MNNNNSPCINSSIRKTLRRKAINMAVTVPTEAYTKILTTLWTSGYLTLLLTPQKSLDILRHIIMSSNDTNYIAGASGNAVQLVNKTLTLLYTCVNSTIAANDTNTFWSCLTPSTTTPPVDAGKTCTDLDYNLHSLALNVLFISSLSFLLVMSFIEKRKYRQSCCHGRPGAVVPVNLLDSYENRFGNAMAFAVPTSHCLNVLIGDVKYVLGTKWGAVIDSSPGFVSIFFKMIATVVIALAAYPLFVCMRTPHKRAGSIYGICYCILWLSLQAYRYSRFTKDCILAHNLGASSKNIAVWQAVGELPQLIAILILLGSFIFTLVKAFRRRAERQGSAEDVYDHFQEGYMFKHVRNLVKGAPAESSTAKEGGKKKLKDKLYKWKPEFKYSTRVICAFTVSSIILYLLTMFLLYWCWYLFDNIIAKLSKTKEFEDFVKSLVPNQKNIVEEMRTHFKIWTACFYTAIILSTIKTVFVYLNMLSWYRGHIMRLRRGDRSWLPSSIRTLSASPSSLVAASMKYAGFQVGYATWGYLMFALLIWILLGIIVSFIFYPLFTGKSSILLKLLYTIWPGLLISLIVAQSQRLAAMFIFLQQRGKIISIDNRNAFHITSYFLFYFNIFLGVISCLLRIIKSIIIGVIFLERVQKSLLPRSFERMDPGYFAYVGYILIEHSHANPVLCVFFYLLKQHTKQAKSAASASVYRTLNNDDGSLNGNLKTVDEEKRAIELKTSSCWRIARNRWNLAYTLLNNPSLSQYRSHNLEKGKKDNEGNEKNKETESEAKRVKVDLSKVSII